MMVVFSGRKMMEMLKGELTKIKTMSFDVQGETMKFDYKVKGINSY